MRTFVGLVLSMVATGLASPAALAQPAPAAATALVLPVATGSNGPAYNLPIERLRPLAQSPGSSLLTATPKVGPFALTFYSDMPATGFDGMVNAEVVISLTRKF